MPGRITLPTALLSCLLLAVSPDANAREQYIAGTIEQSGDQEKWVTGLAGRYGRALADPLTTNLKLFGEIRASFGITEQHTRLSSAEVNVRIQSLVGAYASLRNPIKDSKLTPYLMLGFTHVRFKASRPGHEAHAGDSDLSFGMGVDWKVGENLMLNVDGMRYMANSGGDLFGFSVGVSRWFD